MNIKKDELFEILHKAIDEKFQFEHDNEIILTKDSINDFTNCVNNDLKNINNNGVSDEDFIKSKIENLVNKYPNIAAKIWTSFQEDEIEYNIYIFPEEIYKDMNYCKDETSIKDEFKQKYDSYVNFLSCNTYDENIFTKYKSYILKLKGKHFQNNS